MQKRENLLRWMFEDEDASIDLRVECKSPLQVAAKALDCDCEPLFTHVIGDSFESALDALDVEMGAWREKWAKEKERERREEREYEHFTRGEVEILKALEALLKLQGYKKP